MTLEQLMGRYFRLTQELAIVRKAQPWQSGLIDRLAGELSAVEREIAALTRSSSPPVSRMQRAA